MVLVYDVSLVRSSIPEPLNYGLLFDVPVVEYSIDLDDSACELRRDASTMYPMWIVHINEVIDTVLS